MGKILGEGAFGCVVEPEVPCDTNIHIIRSDSPKKTVSKLYFNTDKDNEYEMSFSSKLHKMDPAHQYFAVPVKTCSTRMKTLLKKAPEAKNCESFDSKIDLIPQIVMENEGEDLHLIMHRDKMYSIVTWIRQLENVLNGIQVLIDHKIVHQDIRLTNVSLSDRLKLLDFGLSAHFNDIYTKTNKRLYIDYFPYPFEYLLASDHFIDKNCLNYKSSLCNKLLQFEWLDYTDSFGHRTYNNYNIFYPKEYVKKDTYTVIQWYMKNPEKWIKKIQKYTDRIDLYSLGMMCVDALKFMDIEELSPPLQKLYIEWIYGLIQIDVRKRFDIRQAKELYDKMIVLLGK